MKQVLQSLKDGSTQLADVPSPRAASGQLLIHTSATLVSAGTERMLIEFGKANWLDKARQQPDKVRKALEKVRTDGLAATFEAVQSKLDQPRVVAGRYDPVAIRTSQHRFATHSSRKNTCEEFLPVVGRTGPVLDQI